MSEMYVTKNWFEKLRYYFCKVAFSGGGLNMQEMIEFLSQYRKPMPEWLRKFNPDANEKPNLKEVLNSRVVFYPACYDDGFIYLCKG